MTRLRAEEIVLLAAPDPADADDEELPHTWGEIFESAVIDVDDDVLPRRTPR